MARPWWFLNIQDVDAIEVRRQIEREQNDGLAQPNGSMTCGRFSRGVEVFVAWLQNLDVHPLTQQRADRNGN